MLVYENKLYNLNSGVSFRVQSEKQPVTDIYFKSYCKEFTYEIVGAGQVNLRSIGADSQEGQASSFRCGLNLHSTGIIYSFLGSLSSAFTFFKNFYWSRVDLQCCVNSCCTAKRIIHIHISTLFQILFPYRSLQSIEQSSLCYTVGPHQLSILYIVVCICQSQSPNLSFPHKS